MPTLQEIEAARTPAGGWARSTLSDWGVPWPPPKGWKAELLAHPVEALLSAVSYKPGWQFSISDGFLRIRATVIDAYDHSRTTPLVMDVSLPPSCARLNWQRWLFDVLLKMERHEAAEFFEVGGVKVFDPHKEATK